ncbi:hypothetical protein DXG01_014998 [Tephrocybe rancida]|nr:hypothetical protein DXG01_014998 [Tephrocybe rancida]
MSGVAAAPAPWQLKSRTWTFLLSGLSATSSFPAGFADPVEAEALVSGGEYIGGPGILMVVSYTETPVDCQDDELIYTPGRWKFKDGSRGFRITRIYVSTKSSTENGRRNWNIPKSVADFDITTSDGVTTIKVSMPGASQPFFHVQTKPVPLLRHIPLPLDTTLFGNYLTLVQPPLPAGPEPERIATTQWAILPLNLRGPGHLERIFPLLDGKVGDGKNFPAIVPWSIGTYEPMVEGEFGIPILTDSV